MKDGSSIIFSSNTLVIKEDIREIDIYILWTKFSEWNREKLRVRFTESDCWLRILCNLKLKNNLVSSEWKNFREMYFHDLIHYID